MRYLEFRKVPSTGLWIWQYVGRYKSRVSFPMALETAQRAARHNHGQGTIPELYYYA